MENEDWVCGEGEGDFGWEGDLREVPPLSFQEYGGNSTPMAQRGMKRDRNDFESGGRAYIETPSEVAANIEDLVPAKRCRHNSDAVAIYDAQTELFDMVSGGPYLADFETFSVVPASTAYGESDAPVTDPVPSESLPFLSELMGDALPNPEPLSEAFLKTFDSVTTVQPLVGADDAMSYAATPAAPALAPPTHVDSNPSSIYPTRGAAAAASPTTASKSVHSSAASDDDAQTSHDLDESDSSYHEGGQRPRKSVAKSASPKKTVKDKRKHRAVKTLYNFLPTAPTRAGNINTLTNAFLHVLVHVLCLGVCGLEPHAHPPRPARVRTAIEVLDQEWEARRITSRREYEMRRDNMARCVATTYNPAHDAAHNDARPPGSRPPRASQENWCQPLAPDTRSMADLMVDAAARDAAQGRARPKVWFTAKNRFGGKGIFGRLICFEDDCYDEYGAHHHAVECLKRLIAVGEVTLLEVRYGVKDRGRDANRKFAVSPETLYTAEELAKLPRAYVVRVQPTGRIAEHASQQELLTQAWGCSGGCFLGWGLGADADRSQGTIMCDHIRAVHGLVRDDPVAVAREAAALEARRAERDRFDGRPVKPRRGRPPGSSSGRRSAAVVKEEENEEEESAAAVIDEAMPVMSSSGRVRRRATNKET